MFIEGREFLFFINEFWSGDIVILSYCRVYIWSKRLVKVGNLGRRKSLVVVGRVLMVGKGGEGWVLIVRVLLEIIGFFKRIGDSWMKRLVIKVWVELGRLVRNDEVF